MIAGKTLYHMNENQQPALCFFVVGLIGLGVIALVVGGFALVWHLVPDWVPARHAIAYGTGVLMVLLGTGLSFRPSGVVRPNSICLPFSVGLVESAWGRCGSRNRSDMAWAR